MNQESSLRGLGELGLTYSVTFDALLPATPGDAIDWKEQNIRYLTESIVHKIPGVVDAVLCSPFAKTARVVLDIAQFADNAAELSVRQLHILVDKRLIEAVETARRWVESVRSFRPALDERIARRRASGDYGYDYVRYSTLVQQEADILLMGESALREIPDVEAKGPLAVTLLVEYWEQVHRARAADFDKLIKE